MWRLENDSPTDSSVCGADTALCQRVGASALGTPSTRATTVSALRHLSRYLRGMRRGGGPPPATVASALANGLCSRGSLGCRHVRPSRRRDGVPHCPACDAEYKACRTLRRAADRAAADEMKAFAEAKREIERSLHAAAQVKARAKAKAKLETAKALPPDAPARTTAESKEAARLQTRATDAKRCRARKKALGLDPQGCGGRRRPSRAAGHAKAPTKANKRKKAPPAAPIFTLSDELLDSEFLADLGYAS